MYKIELVEDMVFTSKIELEKVAVILANNDIKFDIVEGNKIVNEFDVHQQLFFEDPTKREKFKAFIERKKIVCLISK